MNTTTLISKISINGEHEYQCYPLTCSENMFEADFLTDDVAGVIECLETIEYVDVYNYENLLEKRVTDFNSYSSVSLIIKNGEKKVRVKFLKTSVYDKVKELDEKVNGVVNETDMTLEEFKEYKIAQSKEALASYLEANPLVSSVKGGVEAEYSITAEKQGLMSNAYLTYLIKKQTDPDAAKLMWNAKGETCTEWTEEEFVQLVLEIEQRVHPLVSYQQEIESQLKSFGTKAEIASIKFDFDSVAKDENNGADKVVA